MRILVISHLYPCAESSTKGIFVKAQVEALKKAGHEVDVFVPCANKKVKEENASTYFINYLSLSNPGLLIDDIWLYRKIDKKIGSSNYDVILAHTVLPDGAAAIKLGQKYHLPVAIFVHGADVQKKTNKIYLKRKIITTLNAANLVLVNSQKTKGLVDGLLGKNTSKIAYLGVRDVKLFNKPSSRALKILTVANLMEEKGIIYAIRAVSELLNSGQKIIYEIIGSGPELKKLQKTAKGQKQIIFMGKKDNEFVQKKMAEADLFLLPSHNEAFGIVYLEALWQKTPVIGCEGQGVEDIIAKGKCGFLVKPKDVDSIKKAIKSLEDKKTREKMGVLGHQIVSDYFLWDNLGKDLSKKLEELSK